jgi:hypothetical protein
MKKNSSRHFINVLFLTAVLTFTAAQESHAYLDLGTGSYLLQIGLATLFAGFFFAKNLWSRVISFFGRTFKTK